MTQNYRNIFSIALSLVLVFTSATPVLAGKRFTEQAIETKPEQSLVTPLAFVTSKEETDFFAPIFLDKTDGKVRNAASGQKVIPIFADDLVGISTYFNRFHPGIDYRAKVGTAIHAILPGSVNEIGYEQGGYGRYVVLVHHLDGKTLFSLYAHMRETEVIVGDSIEAGQKIGEVGLTGHTTGPHLHFEIHDSERALDPLKFFTINALAMKI